MSSAPTMPDPDLAGLSSKETAARDLARQAQEKEHPDADAQKGSVEDDQPNSSNQVSMTGQLGHRMARRREPSLDHEANEQADDQIKDSDTDFPEPGSSPEHSGQHR